MTDRPRSRTAPTGRAAPCAPARRRGVRRPDLGRVLLAWLAVLAIVVQTTVPDFAMAARRAAQQRAETAAAHHVLHGHHGGEHGQPDTPAPARHEHEPLCAFCLALGTHGLEAAPADALPAPVAYEAAALPVEAGVRLPPFFLTGHNPRAPPAPRQV